MKIIENFRDKMLTVLFIYLFYNSNIGLELSFIWLTPFQKEVLVGTLLGDASL